MVTGTVKSFNTTKGFGFNQTRQAAGGRCFFVRRPCVEDWPGVGGGGGGGGGGLRLAKGQGVRGAP